jgi:hypothetical protein
MGVSRMSWPAGSREDRGRLNDRAQTIRCLRRNMTVALRPGNASMMPALFSDVGWGNLASRGPGTSPGNCVSAN